MVIPAFFFLFIWMGLQIFSQAASRGDQGGGVAYFAHIGGFAAGIVLIIFFQTTRRRTARVVREWQ